MNNQSFCLNKNQDNDNNLKTTFITLKIICKISVTVRNAEAVIHTHSKAAVMATLLYPGNEFKITNQEMIKVSN